MPSSDSTRIATRSTMRLIAYGNLLIWMVATGWAVWLAATGRWGGAVGIELFSLIFLILFLGVRSVFLQPDRWEPLVGVRSIEGIGPATVVDYRPNYLITSILALTVFGGCSVAVAGSIWNESHPGAVIVGLFGLFLLSFLPDNIRVVRRRPYLAVTPTGFTSHGWSTEGSLDWADVSSIGLKRLTALRIDGEIVGSGGAASWQSSRHFLIWPLEPRSKQARIALPAPAIGITALDRVLRGLSYYAAHPESRHELGTSTATERLNRPAEVQAGN